MFDFDRVIKSHILFSDINDLVQHSKLLFTLHIWIFNKRNMVEISYEKYANIDLNTIHFLSSITRWRIVHTRKLTTRLQFLIQEINVPPTFRLNLLDVGNVESAIRELPSFQSPVGELRRPGQALCRHRRRFCMTVAKIAKHQLRGSPC